MKMTTQRNNDNCDVVAPQNSSRYFQQLETFGINPRFINESIKHIDIDKKSLVCKKSGMFYTGRKIILRKKLITKNQILWSKYYDPIDLATGINIIDEDDIEEYIQPLVNIVNTYAYDLKHAFPYTLLVELHPFVLQYAYDYGGLSNYFNLQDNDNQLDMTNFRLPRCQPIKFKQYGNRVHEVTKNFRRKLSINGNTTLQAGSITSILSNAPALTATGLSTASNALQDMVENFITQRFTNLKSTINGVIYTKIALWIINSAVAIGNIINSQSWSRAANVLQLLSITVNFLMDIAVYYGLNTVLQSTAIEVVQGMMNHLLVDSAPVSMDAVSTVSHLTSGRSVDAKIFSIDDANIAVRLIDGNIETLKHTYNTLTYHQTRTQIEQLESNLKYLSQQESHTIQIELARLRNNLMSVRPSSTVPIKGLSRKFQNALLYVALPKHVITQNSQRTKRFLLDNETRAMSGYLLDVENREKSAALVDKLSLLVVRLFWFKRMSREAMLTNKQRTLINNTLSTLKRMLKVRDDGEEEVGFYDPKCIDFDSFLETHLERINNTCNEDYMFITDMYGELWNGTEETMIDMINEIAVFPPTDEHVYHNNVHRLLHVIEMCISRPLPLKNKDLSKFMTYILNVINEASSKYANIFPDKIASIEAMTTAVTDCKLKIGNLFPGMCLDEAGKTIAQALSYESVIKMCLGVVTVGITLLDSFGITGIAQKFIVGNNLRKALNDTSSTLHDLVESVSQEVFNISISGDTALVNDLTSVADKLTEFLGKPDHHFTQNVTNFYAYKTELAMAEKMFTAYRGSKSDKESTKRAYNLLQAVITRANMHVMTLSRAIVSMSARVETLVFNFAGWKGGGKSTFLNNWLMPRVAERMGWSKNIYAINFAEKSYFPPYNGQAIGIYDEFLARRSEDPMVKSLNGIASTGHANMEGADICYKTQPCNLRALFTASNSQYVNLSDAMSHEASDAFYSRIHQIGFVNKNQENVDIPRYEIVHADDFSHIQLRKYIHHAGPLHNETVWNYDPNYHGSQEHMFEEVTKEQLLDWIVEELMAAEQRHAKFNTTMQEQMRDHLVILLNGFPGTGKSTMATKMGKSFSKLFRMPYYEFTSLKDRPLIDKPSVVITHDCLTNEENYMSFYDSLPYPSIIINTANLRLKQRTQVQEGNDTFRELTIYEKMFSRLQRSLQKVTLTYIDENRPSPQPGFIRRIGIPGYVGHGDQVAFVKDSDALYLEQHLGFRTYSALEGKYITLMDVSEEIASKYKLVSAAVSTYKFKYVNEFTIDEPVYDVDLVAGDIEKLREMCNSKKNCIRAYLRGLKGTETPYVKITDRVVNGSFMFDPDMFLLPTLTLPQDMEDLGSKSYAVLHNANRTYTFRLKIEELEIRAKGGVLEAMIKSNVVSTMSWEIEGSRFIVNETSMENDVLHERVIGDYSLTGIINGLLYGFQHSEIGISYKIMNYISQQEEKILKHPLADIAKLKTKTMQTISMSNLSNMAAFGIAWESFKQTKTFWVVVVLLTIILLFTTIVGVLGLTNFLTKKEETNTCVKNLPAMVDYNGRSYICEWNTKDSYNYTLIIPHYSDHDMEATQEYFRDLFKELKPKSKLSAISFTQSDPSADTRSKQKHASKTKATRLQPLKPIAQENDVFRAIIDKVSGNIVTVTVSGMSVRGLAIKQNYILSVSHVVRHGTYGVIVDNNTCYSAKCIFDSPEREISLWKVTDQTFAPKKDITKYFVKEKFIDVVSENVLVKKNKRGVLQIYNGCCTLKRQHVKKTDITQVDCYYTGFYSTKHVTEAGDCGFPYLAINQKLNEGIITGLHFAIDRTGETRSTIITHEIIQELLATQNNVVTKETTLQFKDSADIYMKTEFITEEQQDKYVPMEPVYVDEIMLKYIDDLQPVMLPSDNTVFTSPTVQTNLHIVGHDPKGHTQKAKHQHVKSLFYDNLSPLVCEKDNSALSIAEVEDTSQLVVYGGKPNIELTQLSYYNDKCEMDPDTVIFAKQACEFLKDKYVGLYKANHRILTDFETINGTFVNPRDKDVFGYLEGLDRDASCGHGPMRRYGFSKKGDFLTPVATNVYGKHMYTWKDTPKAQQLSADCYLQFLAAMQGLRFVNISTTKLKDELLPLEKVRIGKTRLFENLSMEDVYILRRGFGTVMAVMNKNHIKGSCQVGINPIPEFDRLANRLMETSNFGEAGDPKRYDKHLIAFFIKLAIDIFTAIQTDSCSEEDKVIFANLGKVAVQMIVYTFSIVGKIVFLKTRGNPSGNVLTTQLNSTVNDLYTVTYCLIAIDEHNRQIGLLNVTDKEALTAFIIRKYGEQFVKFNKIIAKKLPLSPRFVDENTDYITLGDDVCQAVKDKYLWLFNFVQKQRIWKQYLGLDYDTPKKDDSVYYYSTVNEMEFLSRKFHKLPGESMVFPALKTISIEGMLFYTTENSPSQLKANCENVLNEAVLHGKEYYNKIAQVIKKNISALRERNIEIDLWPMSYENAAHEVRQKILFNL